MMFLNFRRKKRVLLLRKLKYILEQDKQMKPFRPMRYAGNRDVGCSQHPTSF